MKTIEEVQAAIDALDNRVNDLGLKQAYGTSADFHPHANPSIFLPLRSDDGGNIWGHGDTMAECFADINRKLDKIGTAEERAMKAFQAQLGALIDKGNELGISVEYLNPITEMARKLAENALTHQPAE